MAGQLPLILDRPDRYRMDLFVPGGAAREAWARVQALLGGEERFVFLWGESGTGKTHLLEAAARSGSGRYLDLGAIYGEVARAGLDPETALGGEPGTGLVVLDRVEAVAGDPAWEAAVFHLYNRVAEEGGRLLAAARANPNSLDLVRGELRSRLHWGGSYPMGRLDEAETLAALQGHAGARGLELREEVGRFLLRRYSRNMHRLMAALEWLDAAALAERRRLTVPFVKAQLGL